MAGFRRAYVRGEYATTKSARAVPLADRVARELEGLSRRSRFTGSENLVFGHPLTGEPLNRAKILRRFKAALKAAGVREVRFHDLRHTYGTGMASVGTPERILREYLGHRDPKTTATYADYRPSERYERELVERAFDTGASSGSNLSATHSNSEDRIGSNTRGEE